MAEIFTSFHESEYELLRKRKIEENNEMLRKLFGDKPSAIISQRSPLTTTTKPGTAGRQSRQKKTPLGPSRRNPRRNARSYHSNEEIVYTEDDDQTESEDLSSDQGDTRLVVRWVGPLTKKRRLDSNAITSEGTLFDTNETSLVKKQRLSSVTRVLRPASDFTEDELLLIASCVKEKNYDPVYGSSCHQCRQKTDDLKTICRSEHCVGIRGQFCGPCLKNRYGESVREALLDDDWSCPPCRNVCNCSFCMKKRGRRCTGQLINVARQNGFHDVKSFLGD